MKNLLRYTSIWALYVGIAAAQNSAGTGSISGVVQDATGSVIPGAAVTIENQDKGIRRDLITTQSGLFSAPSLVPSAGYRVSVKKEGFNEYVADNLQVSVGQTINLTPSLAVGGTATQVDVLSQTPIVETTKTDVSQVVTSEQILELPINGRRVDAFVLLSPGVTTDGSFGLLSFRGTPGGNSFITDGVDTTNSFYDENAGRTRTYNISLDAVQEFQVVTSNFLAEYGRASGGVVNTITRSGTNNLHGTAYWFFRNRTLDATDITANGFNPQDWRHQAGASLGGPIRKDKLFYFFNGELQRRNNALVSSNISNSNLFSSPTTFKSTACASPATPAQCAAAETYILSRARPQLVPRTSDVNLLFGKIDYQLNQANTLTFSLNYLDFRSPNGIQTQQVLTNGSALGNNADTNVFDRTGKAGLTTIVSPNSVNELRFGYFKDRQYDPNSASLLPSFGPIGLSIGGATNIGNIGYSTNYNRLDPSEQRFQVADTLSYITGKHNLKFGVDFSNTEDFVKLLRNPYGTYSYPSLTAFAQDFSTGGKHWNSFSQAFGNPVVDTYVSEVAGFIQDEWHLTPKLTVSPGIRYEKSLLPQPVNVNPVFPQTHTIPQTKLNFAPRFGLAYALNGKTVLRGGYGVFFNRYVTSTISSLYTNNGQYQTSYSLNSSIASQLAGGPSFPHSLSQPPTNVRGTSSLAFADQGYRNAYSQQLDVSFERQIAKDTSFTTSYIWSRGLHLLSGRDINAAAPTASYTYPILDATGQQVSSYTTPIYLQAQRVNRNYGQIILVDSGGNSWYNGLTLQVQKRYTRWFQGSAAYTYSHAIDTNVGGGGNTLFTPGVTSVFNGDYSHEKGSSSTDQRHRLTVTAVLSPRFAKGNSLVDRYLINNWELSILSVAASAQPLAPTISVGPSVSGLDSNSTINGLGGSSRVPFESTSALNIDQLYRTDLRLTKTLPFSERFRVRLIFEATNAFNHPYLQGPGPRVQTQYTTVSYNGKIALAPFSTYGAPLQTQAPPDGTTARRAQAAIRIEF